MAARACSIECADTIYLLLTHPTTEGHVVTDKNEHEVAAIEHASDMAGEFLESLRKTDLAKLTREEWLTLLDVIVTGYQDKMISQEVPF